MKRTALFILGLLMILVLFTACQKADASAPEVTPTVTETVAPTQAATVKPTPTATVTPTPIETPVPTETPDPEAVFVEKILSFVNEARVENGMNELALSPSLCAAARIRADELRQKVEAIYNPQVGYYYDMLTRKEYHSRLNGDSFGTVLDEVGIVKWKQAGENVYCASRSTFGVIAEANRAFSGWKHSPDHWDAILNGDWLSTGIALLYYGDGFYAVQLFTTGHIEAPEYAEPSPTAIAP